MIHGSATLPAAFTDRFAAESWLVDTGFFDAAANTEEAVLDSCRELERFLASVEQRAFKIAQIALRDVDDALDCVQDAMLQLARRYATRPGEEWQPLFYSILRNRIRDCQRRRMVRARVMAWLPTRRHEDDAPDPIETAAGQEPAPLERVQMDETLQALERALQELPQRQQQAFMLRNFEGLDVAGTAAAMGCSAGSVKTHYFRAVQTLRERLGDFW
jgi:RNA polymerase sigma-70 factor (ECF subfamily)